MINRNFQIFVLFISVCFISCNTNPYIVFYLTNVHDLEEQVNIQIEIDSVMIFEEKIKKSDITPSLKEVYSRVTKGKHNIKFTAGDKIFQEEIFHSKIKYYYVSYTDSIGIGKIAVISSDEPFKHH